MTTRQAEELLDDVVTLLTELSTSPKLTEHERERIVGRREDVEEVIENLNKLRQ